MNRPLHIRILTEARNHITDPEMWIQGSFSSEDGLEGARQGNPCCIVGAIWWAYERYAQKNGTDHLAIERAISALSNQIGKERPALYNDRPETTHADVLNLLDAAIKYEESVDEL